MRVAVLLAVLALSFASCSSVKNFELGLHGDAKLNPNEENQPNTVRVKVLRLKGEESMKAFLSAPFDALWADPITAENVAVDGAPQTLYVPTRAERVPVALQAVPPEVTHVGVLGLFNNPVTGKDRVAIARDDLGSVEVWLHDNVIGTQNPAAPKPATGEKQGS